MGFWDKIEKGNTSREGRGHPRWTKETKDRLAQTKTGRKVTETRDRAARISEGAKKAAGKEAPCANPACKKKTKNGYVCSPKCAKEAAKNF